MSKSLAGRNAIVSGGSRGIGKGIALELAKRGANVLITYEKSAKAAEGVVEQIEKLGTKGMALQASCLDIKSPGKIVKALVEAWGKIHIIINNAGIGDDIFLEDLTESDFDRHIIINVRMPIFLVKAAMQFFGEAPRIVNVSSIMARVGSPQATAYTASKSALEGVTKVLAIELGHKYGATVNCVNPGPVETDMWLQTDKDVRDMWEANKAAETPAAPRIGTVDDIAQIVAFLSEEQSRWTTGSTVCANGGMVCV
ncbi:dehydrogenase with different specificitie [Talaromyces proteolyticus]|uniref:3-oxoacyl-[acyl-carrier-protein] reductase n=1 Tax=Talaromyces proteolyticus TaxID=1131652 RepID=A0AAD4KLS5_9EURO|nr:dehydrogenase with different specificitie [Talaromyces proteolyticus]KAH8693057.1 dehydrogenase with different specificitie [Talaromyces proteolyticus]